MVVLVVITGMVMMMVMWTRLLSLLLRRSWVVHQNRPPRSSFSLPPSRDGGTRTPRQVVTLLLRGLLIPAKEQSRVLAESYDDLVGAERSLDSTDDHAEQMRLQLLYVGALETSLQLYVVV